jgi:hypothetical protein
VCRKRKENELEREEFNLMKEELTGVIALESARLEDIYKKLPFNRDKLTRVIQWLLDNGILRFTPDQRLVLSKKHKN